MERALGSEVSYAIDDRERLLALVDAQAKAIERMLSGLRRYGVHDNGNKDSRDDCARFYKLSAECSCGLDALLREVGGGEG